MITGRRVDAIIVEYFQKATQGTGSQLNFQSIKIEEGNGIKMLVEVEKKGSGFWQAHFCGLAFVREEDRAFHPMDIDLRCGPGIVFIENGIPSLIKQLLDLLKVDTEVGESSLPVILLYNTCVELYRW